LFFSVAKIKKIREIKNKIAGIFSFFHESCIKEPHCVNPPSSDCYEEGGFSCLLMSLLNIEDYLPAITFRARREMNPDS